MKFLINFKTVVELLIRISLVSDFYNPDKTAKIDIQ